MLSLAITTWYSCMTYYKVRVGDCPLLLLLFYVLHRDPSRHPLVHDLTRSSRVLTLLTYFLSFVDQTIVQQQLDNTSDRRLKSGKDPSVIDRGMLSDTVVSWVSKQWDSQDMVRVSLVVLGHISLMLTSVGRCPGSSGIWI